MELTKEEIIKREIKELLLRTDPTERSVIFMGCGIAFSNIPEVLNFNIDKDKLRVDAKKVAYTIGELAVVPVAELEQAINNSVRYKRSGLANTIANIAGALCHKDVFLVNDYFTEEDFKNIDIHIGLFKKSTMWFNKYFVSLLTDGKIDYEKL